MPLFVMLSVLFVLDLAVTHSLLSNHKILIWTFGVFSWIISVCIAMVAAPMWAIAHATPDGDDAIGGGMRGYVLLMSVTLRPALMLFGLFFAMLAMYATDKMLTIGFMPAFVMSQTNNVIGPIVTVSCVIMYGVVSFVLVQACFRIIQKIPETIR